MSKIRIDHLLVEQNLASSLKEARAFIMAGEIFLGEKQIWTPGTLVYGNALPRRKVTRLYVSRGGHKLAGALEDLEVDVEDCVCADIGASTGGFTDVLLQAGARRVYAIDVGYGDLAWKLRQDARVVVMERTNARYLQRLEEPIDLVVADVSFISLRSIMPVIKNWLQPDGQAVLLIKPQFEAPKSKLEPGGLVTRDDTRRLVLHMIVDRALELGFSPLSLVPATVTGARGNQEFLIHLSVVEPRHPVDILQLLDSCLMQLT